MELARPSVAILLLAAVSAASARFQHRLAMDNYGLVHPRQQDDGRRFNFLPDISPVFYYGGRVHNNEGQGGLRGGGGPAAAAIDNRPIPAEEPADSLSSLKRSGAAGSPEEYDESSNGQFEYEPRVGAVKQRSEIRREQELRRLYDKIAREFPFIAKQGLKEGADLNDLFAMTLFGQPKGRRRR